MGFFKLNERQKKIIIIAKKSEFFQTKDVFADIKKDFNVERLTIVRDLTLLEKYKILLKTGQGRSVKYKISAWYLLVEEINAGEYFSKEGDKRKIKEKFNFEIFSNFKNFFSSEEKDKLQSLNKIYLEKVNNLPADALKKEIERLNIDFSWKSSKIEGNTYSILETEQLIKNHQTASGHTKDEAVMILNHKITLDYIRQNKNIFKKTTQAEIESIHSLLTSEMNITKGVRKNLVRITGTKYAPLDNEFQIKEALINTCRLSNNLLNPFEKALALMLLIAYIQPFIDGNKRTSRLCGNAILIAYDCCPMSYRSIDDTEYKKATLLFYEQNNISYFKQLFIEQFEFAVNNYFG